MIPLFKVYMSDRARKAAYETLGSGYITQGTKVEEFENDLKEFFQLPYIITVNSATSGLQLAVHMSGAKHGSWVISTPMTCSATNTAILANGAGIIWADINPLSGNIDPNSVEDILKKANGIHSDLDIRDIKAIMCVDWGGNVCDLPALRYLADKYGIRLIRDAAHAFGAKYDGHMVGDWSDYTVYSFQAIKHLTTVDGGAIILRTEKDYERAKLLRWYGIDREGSKKDMRCEEDITEAGFKYHMNDVNASIGIENLKDMNTILNKYYQNGKYYDSSLADSAIKPVMRSPKVESSYWIYTVLVPEARLQEPIRKLLSNKKILSSKIHSRVDLHTAFQQFKKNLPGVDHFSSSQLNIPVGWWLTEEERCYIIDAILEISERV